jgi:hypothetical protein
LPKWFLAAVMRVGAQSKASFYYQAACFHHQSGGHKAWPGFDMPFKKK